MIEEKEQENSPQPVTGRQMTRQEIIQAVTEPVDISVAKKNVIISTTPEQADFQEIVKNLGIETDSIAYRIFKSLCEHKKATNIDAQALGQRIQNLSDEELKILELICAQADFTVKAVLEFIFSLKKFGTHRILILRAFTDLEGVAPGSLNRFIMAALPQGKPEEVGKEAYENELLEKRITPDQVNVFYHILSWIPGLTPETAIAILPKIRQLEPQHTHIINTFLKKGASFGDAPIGNNNILGFLNLWLSLPELTDKDQFRKLVKKLSRQPDKTKKNFQYIVHFFKEETEKEKKKKNPSKNMSSRIRNFFG